MLDAVDRLRSAAGEQHRISRMVRVGTVNAATVPLLIPAVREFRAAHPVTQVEVVGAQQTDIHRILLEGGFDLGLVNHLEGDDVPAEFESTELLRGRPVVCVRPDSPLASAPSVSVDDLLDVPLIGMRSGYVMHRYVHRLLDGRGLSFAYSTDGAEMGKLMVAEGLGATVLPDFSVIGDPLERRGALTHRPISGDTTRVLLMLQRRRAESVPQAARDLHEVFVRTARTLSATPEAP
ncbi:LysR family transcriptional regulator [Streptomyces asoensis]|uniref:LysR family transcriptional regulator n=1 Tax=Streptomyces asoensis TaxID=249586 RepID=A0A6M4WHX0_9ACTN|nr:LysR family transcriptional regulator [Streptomyces asoensis]